GETQAKELPIVGRETELELFDDLRARVVGGSGWIASIIAEAGLGKTRLVHEVRRRAGESQMLVSRFDETGDVSWMFGASRSYDSNKPFSTIRDLLRRWWDIDEAADEFGRVEAASADSGVEDPDTAAFLAYIGGITPSDSARGFLDALETPALHASASRALSSYLEAVANQRPLSIVIEDLHWADDLSLAIVEAIMDLTERAPIGLIVAFRPYREETSWRIHEVAERDHHHRYHHIDLPPLPSDDSTALIDALLDESGVSDDTKRRILDRSDGNPLFIEEMVRAIDRVMEPGDLAIPTSLTAMLTARLDRLDEESRFVVQMASVLGTEFDRAMLVGILEDPLDANRIPDLLRQGIFVETPRAPNSLGFRHALIQEAAYETILRRTRRELHRRVADHLISASPRAVQDIAFHLVEANQADVAFPYLIEAGMQASRSMSLADAIRLLTTAMDNAPVDADPALIEQAHEALGEAYALVPDLSQASAAYQRLYEFGEESARPLARVMALNHLGYATAALGADLDGAHAYLDQARILAEEIGDELGLAQYHMNACFVASLGGQVAEAAAHDEATVALGEKAGVDWIRLSGLVRRAINYCFLLDLEKGASAVEAALEAAEGEAGAEARALVNCFGSSVLAQARGDLQEAVEVANREHATLERYSSFYLPMNFAKIGGLLFELGDLEGALAQLVSGRRAAERLRQPLVKGPAASGMAVVYAAAGVSESIPELRDEAERAIAGPMGEFSASTTWANLGFTDLMSGNAEQAAAAFSKGLATSSITRFLERPRLLGGKALALLMSDDLEDAAPLLEQAWAFVNEKKFFPFNPLLHLVEGELAMRQDRLDKAEESLVAGQQAAMESGQRLTTVRILEARARVALRSGSGEAAHHLEMARSAVDAMAMSMADEMLRERFVATRLETLDLIADKPSI
ncbi:MAG: ATP-binding protein, partial [Acidimicrobiia bacterium]